MHLSKAVCLFLEILDLISLVPVLAPIVTIIKLVIKKLLSDPVATIVIWFGKHLEFRHLFVATSSKTLYSLVLCLFNKSNVTVRL